MLERTLSLSQYRVVFDERSYGWTNSKRNNLIFLKHQESWFNELLRKKGYLFLKDVYEGLGMPITKESCIVGWICDEKNNKIGDNFVKFDIHETNSSNYIVDFNVDGKISSRL